MINARKPCRLTLADTLPWISHIALKLHLPPFQVQCCGADGPMDWIEYTSTFSDKFGPANQWPLSCCKRNSNFEVENPEACKIGHSQSLFIKVSVLRPLSGSSDLRPQALSHFQSSCYASRYGLFFATKGPTEVFPIPLCVQNANCLGFFAWSLSYRYVDTKHVFL